MVRGLSIVQAKDVRVDSQVHDVSTDLQSGVYEGGFKLWECSLDLVDYLKDCLPPGGGWALDMGCGHGLPGIVCAQRGFNVVFQDFNSEVLLRQTMHNVKLNVKLNDNNRQVFYMAGDWNSCVESLGTYKFDFILASETIYSTDTFAVHAEIFNQCLSPTGIALVAAKRFYFGVGGGSTEFMEYIQGQTSLKCRKLSSFNDGSSNVRDLVLVERI